MSRLEVVVDYFAIALSAFSGTDLPVETITAPTIDTKNILDANLPPNSNLVGEEINNGRSHQLKDIIIHSVERDSELLDTRKGKFVLQQDDNLVIAVKSDILLPLIAHRQLELKAMKGFGKFYKSTDIKQIESGDCSRFPA